MATLTDRPKDKSPAHPGPARAPKRPRRPPRRGVRVRAPEPNTPRERALACLYLFGPAVALLLGALAALGTAVALALGGSAIEPPATGAAELVPSNALLYVHVSTDPSRPAVKQAMALSRRLPGSPLLFAAVTSRLDAMLGGSATAPVNFTADVRPWLGREAALAVLDTAGSSAGSLIVLDVRARRAADRFLASRGMRPAGSYRGVRLLVGDSGTMLAFLRHYLVLGQATSVRAAIDVARRRAPSLAADRGYRGVAADAPAGRVLDLYASADGVQRALVPSSGLLGILGALLDQRPLSAATISLSPAGRGLQIGIHSTFVPRFVRMLGYRPVQFAPSLPSVLPAGSALLLDARNLRSSLPPLLSLGARLGIAGRIGPLLSRLGAALAAQGLDVGQVLRIFSGETVLAITPARHGSGPAPVIVTRASHPDEVRGTVAALEAPLMQVFAPPTSGPGEVPTVSDVTVAGVPARELSLAPGFELVYAVAHGLLVMSTGPSGVAGVLDHAKALTDAPSFESAVGSHPSRVTSLVFFDLSQLLRLGEQAGLIDTTRQAMLWTLAERIRAVGLASWRGADDTTTQVQLQIP